MNVVAATASSGLTRMSSPVVEPGSGNPQPYVSNPSVARPSSFSNFTMSFVRDHALAASRLSASSRPAAGPAASTASPQRPSFFVERGLVDSHNSSSPTSPPKGDATPAPAASVAHASSSSSNRITIRCMAVVEDKVWAGEKDGRLAIFDAKTGELKRRFERKSEYFPYCIALVAPFVWVGFNDGSLRAFDLDSLGCVKEVKEHSGPINCIEVPAGGGVRGDEAFTAGADFMIVRWSSVTVERIAVINAHQGLLRSLSWLPQAELLLSGGDDGSLKGWTVQSDRSDPSSAPGLVAVRMDAHGAHEGGGVTAVVTCQHFIWTAGGDGTVRVWEILQETADHEEDDGPRQEGGATTAATDDVGFHPLAPTPSATPKAEDSEEQEKKKKKKREATKQQQRKPKAGHSVTHFELVHEIRAPHTHAVSKLIRVGDTVWSVCLGSIFVWNGQEPFDELARYVGEHAGYVTSCAVVRESAVARVWSAGAEGGFCVWNAESELVPAARLGYDALAQLTPLQPMDVFHSASFISSSANVNKSAAAASSSLRRATTSSSLMSASANTAANRRRASPRENINSATATATTAAAVATTAPVPKTHFGVQCDLGTSPRDQKRGAGEAQQQQEQQQEEEHVDSQQQPVENKSNTASSSVAGKSIKRATSSPVSAPASSATATKKPTSPTQKTSLGSGAAAGAAAGASTSVVDKLSPRSTSKMSDQPQQQQQQQQLSSSERTISPPAAPAAPPAAQPQIVVVEKVKVVGIPEPATAEEAILLSRRLLKKFGAPTDETWRTLLCSTMFSTRLDAESVRRNTDPKFNSAHAVDIDISSMMAIMSNLNFLAEEQQRRIFDIAQSTGAQRLRQLIDRSVNGGETFLPLSVLCLDDWAFANRVWMAIYNRAYLVSVVQNEGVAAVLPSGVASTVTASSSSSSSPLRTAATATASSSSASAPNPADSTDFGVTVVPARLANSVVAKQSPPPSQQQVGDPNKNNSRKPAAASASPPQPPSLSSAVEGVAVERKSIGPDTAAFATEESTAQMYHWLEKQRQQILDAFHACTSRPLANRASTLLLEERAQRERIVSEQLNGFANTCLVKVTFVEKRQAIMAAAQGSMLMMSPQRRAEQRTARAAAAAAAASASPASSTTAVSDGAGASHLQRSTASAGVSCSAGAGATEKFGRTSTDANVSVSTASAAGGANVSSSSIIQFGGAGATEEDMEDLCVAINATSQQLIAQHRQSTRAVLAEFSHGLEEYSGMLVDFNERINAAHQRVEQQRLDSIAKTKEMHQLSQALAEAVKENERLQEFISKSQSAADMSYLQEQVAAAKEELAQERAEVSRMRQTNAEMAREAEQLQQAVADAEDELQLARSPSLQQQNRNVGANNNSGDRCRWLANLVNAEIDKRPDKEQLHRALLDEMQQLEVSMAEKQDSSVVRQRHAAKTLSVDLQSAEVTRDVALEMVRLLRTRVEFFEERDSQWSRLAEMLGDVARMHIDSFVFTEAHDDLQRAARELLQVLDLRSTVGRASAELFRLLGDVMKATQEFRANTEQRPPTRTQMLHFLDRQEHRVGVSREGVRWILANFFSEPELLHLGLSPQLFLPDDRRLKPPVPPSLINLADMIVKNSSPHRGRQQQLSEGVDDRGSSSISHGGDIYIDPWVDPHSRPPQAGHIAMLERAALAGRSSAHPPLIAPIAGGLLSSSSGAGAGGALHQSAAADALQLRHRQPLDSTFTPTRRSQSAEH